MEYPAANLIFLDKTGKIWKNFSTQLNKNAQNLIYYLTDRTGAGRGSVKD